jgi:hypothetical protein
MLPPLSFVVIVFVKEAQRQGVTPTFQHWQQATDPMSEHHPLAVNLRGSPPRRLRHIIIVVVFVKAQ